MEEGGEFGWSLTSTQDKSELWREVGSAFGEQLREKDGLKAHLENIFGPTPLLTTPTKAKENIGSPTLLLNLEILEAKGVKGKDDNGLSDPFCSVFLCQGQKYYSSMKSQTLNPVWGDFFSIGVACAETQALNIQIWHYHPQESLGDKMNRLKQVKGTPTKLGKLLKEIAQVGITRGGGGEGQTSQEFLGCLKLPLKSIPKEGVTEGWWFLGGRTPEEVGIRGQIHLKLTLAQQKPKALVLQKYRQFLHLCCLQELKSSVEGGVVEEWEGSFHPLSQFTMATLQLLWALSSKEDVALCKWLVYTLIQTRDGGIHPAVWPPLWQQTEEAVKNHKYSGDDTQKFYWATGELVESFIKYFENMDKSQREAGPRTVAMLATLQQIVGHLRGGREIKGSNLSVEGVMLGTRAALTIGASELFSQRLVEQGTGLEGSYSTCIERLIQFGHVLIKDLIKGDKLMSPEFKRFLGINYFEIVYTVYDEKYYALLQGHVIGICSQLKSLDPGLDHVTMGTQLFTLYQVIKQFAELTWKWDSFSNEKVKFWIATSFHGWFIPVVPLWLEISYIKALHKMEKTVESDNFQSEKNCSSNKTSSSAMATLKIVSQVALFFSSLDWPIGQGRAGFLNRVLNDLSRLLSHYAQITLFKWVEMDEISSQPEYQVPPSFCVAINNCELIGGVGVAKDLMKKLGLGTQNTQKIGESGSPIELEKRLRNSPLTQAGLDVERGICETLETLGIKIRSTIVQLLLGAVGKPSLELKPLVKYLTRNLNLLKTKLCQKSHFDQMYVILKKNSFAAVKEVIQISIKEQRPPPYFERVLVSCQNLVSFFYPGEASIGGNKMDPSISEMMQLIKFYTVTTESLILKYYQNRENEGLGVVAPRDLGTLTLRVYYSDDVQILRIEILNARYIKPRNPNVNCSPYVKLRLVPLQTFPGSPKFKSNTRKNTTFPLFDESFSMPLSLEEMKGPGLVVFTLRSQSVAMGERDDFLGEAFLPLSSIPWVKTGNNLRQLALVSLNITKPRVLGPSSSSIFTTLENRQWDSFTVDFVKKEREKLEQSL